MLALAPVGRPQAQPAPSVLDLAGLFGAHGFVRDTNGDAIADRIAARIVVPSAPSTEDSLAAANIAARLAFETSALSFPLVVRDGDPPSGADVVVLIGKGNRFVRELMARGDLAALALTPGQGLIAATASPVGNGLAVVVAGADDKGTLAAGAVLAGRLPRLWNMTGVTLTGLTDQVRAYLRARGADPTALAVTSLVVDAERRGLAAVRVRALVTAAQAARAASALEALDAAHRRGLEPQVLNFSDIAATQVELVAAGTSARVVAVARAGLNARTLTPPIDPSELATDSPGDRGRPADGAAGTRGKTFDLSNPY